MRNIGRRLVAPISGFAEIFVADTLCLVFQSGWIIGTVAIRDVSASGWPSMVTRCEHRGVQEFNRGGRESAMPFGPVRFLHAANLWIDHALSGTGPLSGGNRETAEEATLTAFEHVVAAALDSKVDFLLLAGNVFDEEDRSVRTRVALRDAFDRLGQEQIRVFVTPGRADRPEAWRDIPHLPQNVTILFPDDRDSVAVIKNGHVMASVAAGEASNGLLPPDGSSSTIETRNSAPSDQAVRSDDNKRQGPFAVVVTSSVACSAEQLNGNPCDYVALGGDGPRQTISTTAGIAHHPGSTQGLSCAETGPHGCTLVEVDSDRRIDTRFVPTASVRWENLAIAVGVQTTREGLQEQMRSAFECIDPEPTDALWLVTWQVAGCGRLLDALDEDDSLRLELIDSLEQKTESESPRPAVVHRFRLIPQSSPEEPSHANSAAVDPTANGNRLADEYARILAAECLLSPDTLDECLKTVSGLNPTHVERLRSLLPDLDRETIDATVGRLGRTWIAPMSEKGGRCENG